MKGPKRKMNRPLLAAILSIVSFVMFAVSPALAKRGAANTKSQSRSTITARAAILIDNDTGEVLWERNSNLPLPPASTTKVVTAMVALRSGRLDDSFLVSDEAAKEPPSKVHLRAGWRVRLLDLIYAIMLNSANDASVVIAEGIAGSVPAFADLMNAQARRLGAVNSHFVNPNGLPAADHYSTARDLATLFSVAARDPVFDRIASTAAIPIIPTEGGVRAINLRTHNRLLLTNYPYEVIGKTGWTIAAKRCFVGAARVDGRELIVAVLGARDLWGDVRKLIEFGFNGNTRPEVEMARADVEEAPVRWRASGDDEDDATYSGRTSQLLHASQTQVVPVNRTTVINRSQPRPGSTVASNSNAKSKDERKRKANQVAKRSAHQQSVRATKSARPVLRTAGAAQARLSALKPAAKTRASSERPQSKSKSKTKTKTRR